MNLATGLVLFVIIAILFFVVRYMIKEKKAGHSCSGCSGCSGSCGCSCGDSSESRI